MKNRGNPFMSARWSMWTARIEDGNIDATSKQKCFDPERRVGKTECWPFYAIIASISHRRVTGAGISGVFIVGLDKYIMINERLPYKFHMFDVGTVLLSIYTSRICFVYLFIGHILPVFNSTTAVSLINSFGEWNSSKRILIVSFYDCVLRIY